MKQSTKRKSETFSRPLTPEIKDKSIKNSKTDIPGKRSLNKSKRLKPIQLLQANEKSSNNKNNITIPDNESVVINANIQDVTVERTLKKKHFFKNKKLKINRT